MESLDTILDDYLSRVDRGESPNRDDYLSRFPDLADDLRSFFDNLDFMANALPARNHRVQQTDPGPHRAFVATPPDAGAGLSTADQPPLPGYRILEEIGGGSQGVVYKAEQLGTKRLAALKVIREGAFASAADRRRFETEVELASRLKHPSIVSVYESGFAAGRHYFAMEYVEGEPLDAYLSARPLEIRPTLELFLQVCNAVSYAHQHGVIHRDLKPSNLIVDGSGNVHVLDFGLAKAIPVGSTVVTVAVTQVGEFAGTWYYASPEQARKEPSLVDVRSDVYSLGVILYEMLTDCYPYPVVGESRECIARHIVETPPTAPSSIRREIDGDLETLVLSALRKNPEERYQSAAALRADIMHYLTGEPIEAKRDRALYVLWTTLRRYRWYVAGAMTGVAALLAFAITIAVLYSQALSAQATLELRGRLVRESQSYLMDKLDELHWTSNRLAEMVEAEPEAAERLVEARTVDEGLAARLQAQFADAPPSLVLGVPARDSAEYAEVRAWVDRRFADLDEVADVLRHSRLVLDATPSDPARPMRLDDSPRFDFALFVAHALCARAEILREGRDDRKALNRLASARFIASDLADSRIREHKGAALRIRSSIYDTLLAMMDSYVETTLPGGYEQWVNSDPPLPDLHLAAIDERQKLAQMFEGAAVRGPADAEGQTDFETLDQLTEGRYSDAWNSLALMKDLSSGVTPRQAITVVDRYFQALGECEGRPYRAIDECFDALLKQLRSDRAWPLVRQTLPNFRLGFQLKARTEAKRSAARLVVRLFDYRASHGAWPATLGHVEAGTETSMRDPHSGENFRYVLSNGKPLLFSLNADGQENPGRWGTWGAPNTDVRLFPLDDCPDQSGLTVEQARPGD